MRQSKLLPSSLHKLFWDTDPTQVNVDRDKWFVVEKVVNFGDSAAAAWLQQVLKVQEIVAILQQNYNISTKAIQLWAQELHFNLADCKCMQRPLALRAFD